MITLPPEENIQYSRAKPIILDSIVDDIDNIHRRPEISRRRIGEKNMRDVLRVGIMP
jgi:hypothetical protein